MSTSSPLSSPLARYVSNAVDFEKLDEWDKYGSSIDSDKTIHPNDAKGNDAHAAGLKEYTRQRRKSGAAFSVGATQTFEYKETKETKLGNIESKESKHEPVANATTGSTRGSTMGLYSKGERKYEVGGWWA
jgi:hypothetical protein